MDHQPPSVKRVISSRVSSAHDFIMTEKNAFVDLLVKRESTREVVSFITNYAPDTRCEIAQEIIDVYDAIRMKIVGEPEFVRNQYMNRYDIYFLTVYNFELDNDTFWKFLLQKHSGEVPEYMKPGTFLDYGIFLRKFPASRKPFSALVEETLERIGDLGLSSKDQLLQFLPTILLEKHAAVTVPEHHLAVIKEKIWEAYVAKGIPQTRTERVAKLYTIYCIFFGEKQADETERVTLLAKELGIEQDVIDQMLTDRKISGQYMKIFHERLTRPDSTFWSLTVRPWNEVVVVNGEYREKLPSEFVARCEYNGSDLCYHRIDSYQPMKYYDHLETDSYLCAVQTPSNRYSILLSDEITEEIFSEPIDLISHMFLTTVLLAHYKPTLLLCSLTDAVFTHSKELLFCMLESANMTMKEMWTAQVFYDEAVRELFIKHSDKIAYYLKESREKNIPIPRRHWTMTGTRDLVWAGIDPEIDSYMNFASSTKTLQQGILLIHDPVKRRRASSQLALFMVSQLIRNAILP